MTVNQRKGSVLWLFLEKYLLDDPLPSDITELSFCAAALNVTEKDCSQMINGQMQIPEENLNRILNIIGISRETFDFHVAHEMEML